MAKRYKPESGPRTGGKASPIDYTGSDEDVGSLGAPLEEIRETGKYLTPSAIEEMKRMVSQGCPVPTAATAVGAGTRAKHWAEKARKHRSEGREPGFELGQSAELAWLEAMEIAKAQLEANMAMTMEAAAKWDWKAALALLERRASRRWHLQSKLSVELGAGKQLEVTSMSTERLLLIARGLLPSENVREIKGLPSGEPAEGEIIENEQPDE